MHEAEQEALGAQRQRAYDMIHKIEAESAHDIEMATAIFLAWCQSGRITEETSSVRHVMDAALEHAKEIRAVLDEHRYHRDAQLRTIAQKAGIPPEALEARQ